MADSEVRLKVLIDTKVGRVLFAEADKKFINFLFNLLSLPLGTVAKVLENESMVGSLGNLYQSVEISNQNRDAILKPKASICGSTMLLPDIASSSTTIGELEGGFVKGLVTYIVMDDLTVKPMSTISTLILLKKLNVEKLDSLEEKFVTLNVDEGLKLLKASLQSNTVLTDVFLGRVPTTPPTSIILRSGLKRKKLFRLGWLSLGLLSIGLLSTRLNVTESRFVKHVLGKSPSLRPDFV